MNYVKNNDSLYLTLREICVTSIKEYAKRLSVDFILMNNNNDRYDNKWNQLQSIEYLKYYDRIMYIDGDCYIPKYFNKNVFNLTKENEIGALVNINGYVNYIFTILSKSIHQIILDDFNIMGFNNIIQHFSNEEIFLNYIINKNKLVVKNLPICDTRNIYSCLENISNKNLILHLLCGKHIIFKQKIINNIRKKCTF